MSSASNPHRRRKLTIAHKRKLRRAIKMSKPWLKSTGPRSFLGRKAVSQNAMKHGLCSRWFPELNKPFAAMMQQLRGKR